MSEIVVTSRTFSGTKELREELLKHFPDTAFNSDRALADDDLAFFIGDARGAIVGLERIHEGVLDKRLNLEIIAKYGVGLDNIDGEACARRNITIGWTGGVNRLSVAEMTLGFMLALSRNLFKTSARLKRGEWDKSGGFELSGKTVGIIGVGHVGKEVIRLLKPFGCRILVNDIIDQADYYRDEGVEEVSKEEIFRRADIVSIHTPLTEATRALVNEGTLSMMRPDSHLINTARGPIVKLEALTQALKSGRLAGAAIDVYNEEPPKDKELLALENVITTPHIGGNSKEAVLAMGMSAIEHLRRHFKR
ncbi:MAG: phosphoglycerate dehydrogenase [bacterium]|nr:phosphoglycerate dehydrogenase [bacterium]